MSINWKGFELESDQITNNLQLLYPKSSNITQQSASGIIAISKKATEMLVSLGLRQYENNPPTFSFAVIPRDKFQILAVIPEQFTWATVCSRSVIMPDENKEDCVVWSSAHEDKLTAFPDDISAGLTEEQADILREAIHEFTHPTMDLYFKYPNIDIRPFSEAIAESIPRLVFGLQKHMPESTAYLTSIQEKDIVIVNDLFQDKFNDHSSEPLNKNIAYASSFLFGAGIISKISTIKQYNIKQAFIEFFDIIATAESPNDAITKLSAALQINETELRTGKSLQLAGQKLVKDLYSTPLTNCEVAKAGVQSDATNHRPISI